MPLTFKLKNRPLFLLPCLALVLVGWLVCAAQPVAASDPPVPPVFKAPKNTEISPVPFVLLSKDLNGDGKADLVGIAFEWNQILVKLADGEGGFGPLQQYPVHRFPWDLAIGDFNSDGKADLVTANYGAGNISIFLGDGAGGFGQATDFPTGDGPRHVVVGDFNGDGKADLAVKINYSPPSIAIMLGDGAGGFAAPTSFEIESDANTLTVGDFNKDGKSDLVVFRAGPNTGFAPGSVSILLNRGAAGFTSTNYGVEKGSPYSGLVGDLNKDGKPDLVVGCDYGDSVYLLTGNGAGGFSPPRRFFAGYDPMHVVSGDFNGDGKPDLATLNNSRNDVSVMLGNGSGSFSKPFTLIAGYDPRGLAAGDFNDDGKSDLAVTTQSYYQLWVYLGNRAGNFDVMTATAGANPLAMGVRDLNGDGYLDVVVANATSNNISVLLGNGKGSFGKPVNYSITEYPLSLALADFNGDGKTDLAVVNGGFDKFVSILLGDGTGRFGAPTNIPLAERISKIAVGDFNGDGKTDLVLAEYDLNSSSILVFLGDGAGGFAAPKRVSVPVRLTDSIAVADFNGDGKSDLALTNEGSNGYTKLSILLSTGNGDLKISLSVNGCFGPIVTGDFNGDGKVDLATGTFLNYRYYLTILIGTGTGRFLAPRRLPNRIPNSFVAADFNGDHLLDLAGANTDPDDVTIFTGSGDGLFSHQDFNYGVGTLPVAIAAGDFNTDGKPDLLTVNGGYNPNFNDGTGSLSILLNVCAPSSLPVLTIADVQVREGDAGTFNAVFTVSLSAASAQQVKVNYETANGSATAGPDYLARSGILTFSPGATTRTISIPIKGDKINENVETLKVILGNATGATVCDAVGVATITDDDPQPSLSINDVSLAEGDTGTINAVFTVKLALPSGKVVTVNFATANVTAAATKDYVATSGRLTFEPGQTSKTIIVPVIGDTSDEADETFKVNLTSPTNAPLTDTLGLGTIIDDDSP